MRNGGRENMLVKVIIVAIVVVAVGIVAKIVKKDR